VIRPVTLRELAAGSINATNKPTGGNMSKFHTLTTKINIYHDTDHPVFGENITEVSIEDEAAGPFIVLEQAGYKDRGKLKFDLEELELVLNVARYLVRSAEREIGLYDASQTPMPVDATSSTDTPAP
jgi:hypothetical protein